MLPDAFRAELYRLSKNRVTLFWAVAFVPLAFLIGGLAAGFFIVGKTKEMAADLSVGGEMATTNLADPLMALAGQVSNVATLAFLMIAAATLFAGDYRWETWRLVIARNSRVNLVLGKLLTLGVMIMVASLAFLLAGMIILVAVGLYEASGLTFAPTVQQWGQFGGLYLTGIARLLQVMVLGLLAAVVTRSLMAALFVPIVISIAQDFAEKMLGFLEIAPTDWQAVFLSPGLAAEHLKQAISVGLPPALGESLVPLSVGSLALWIAVPVGLSLLLFQRQGLSKE